MLTRIKLLTIVTEMGSEDKFINVLKGFEINSFTLTRALGTASPSLMDYFGLNEVKKQIVMCIIPEYLEYDICTVLKELLKYPGAGVAYSIPITASNKFLQDKFKNNKEYQLYKNKYAIANR